MSRGQEKVRIAKQDLPDISVFDDGSLGYILRYRVLSEDQNRYSSWSAIHTLRPDYSISRTEGKGLSDFIVEVQTGGPSTYFNVVWDQVLLVENGTTAIESISEYDVWIKWGDSGSGVWRYKERFSSNSFSLIVPSQYYATQEDLDNETPTLSSPTELSVEIYAKGSPITRDFSTLLAYKVDEVVI